MPEHRKLSPHQAGRIAAALAAVCAAADFVTQKHWDEFALWMTEVIGDEAESLGPAPQPASMEEAISIADQIFTNVRKLANSPFN